MTPESLEDFGTFPRGEHFSSKPQDILFPGAPSLIYGVWVDSLSELGVHISAQPTADWDGFIAHKTLRIAIQSLQKAS